MVDIFHPSLRISPPKSHYFHFFVNTLDKEENKCYTKNNIRLVIQGKNIIITKSKHKEP